MKLRTKQTTYVRDAKGHMTYRKGTEFDSDDVMVAPGEVFEAPDDMIVNLDVFDILEGEPKQVVVRDERGKNVLKSFVDHKRSSKTGSAIMVPRSVGA